MLVTLSCVEVYWSILPQVGNVDIVSVKLAQFKKLSATAFKMNKTKKNEFRYYSERNKRT